MNEEIDIGGGIFIPGWIFWGGVAMWLSVLFRWVLSETGFYRIVWHKGLFDACIFIIVWGGLAALTSARL